MDFIIKKNIRSNANGSIFLTNRYGKCLGVLFTSYFLFPSVAYAYVDPGSGSVIVTTILGLIAAVGYTFRKYFYKLKRFITRSKPQDDEISED